MAAYSLLRVSVKLLPEGFNLAKLLIPTESRGEGENTERSKILNTATKTPRAPRKAKASFWF